MAIGKMCRNEYDVILCHREDVVKVLLIFPLFCVDIYDKFITSWVSLFENWLGNTLRTHEVFKEAHSYGIKINQLLFFSPINNCY